jgi:hypothetical protein
MSLVNYLKKKRREFINDAKYRRGHSSSYRVEGTIKGSGKMLFILSGYKPQIWDDVFSRIKANQLSDMDVCVASSGKYCEELSQICKKNDWIYISTKLNNVCVVTNIVMREFPKADYIFKLDEDIYVPDHYFEDMFNAYQKIEERELQFKIGYVCPELPLGFYGMHKFLVKKGCLEEYESLFGRHYVGGTIYNPAFRENKGIDEYLWRKIGNFDQCAEEYRNFPFTYEVCTTRSGIAAIVYRREFWNAMGCLDRPKGHGVGDNGDEGQITAYCALKFRACFCVNNVFVGHFAFGGSEPNVLKLKAENPEIFEYKKHIKKS